MLAALLPGLRDLRAPLASGYLWLAFAWVCFDSQLQDTVRTNEPLHKLLVESGVFGSTRILAILTFAAFLIGAVLNVSSRRFINLVIWYWDPVWEATVVRAVANVQRRFGRGRPQARSSAPANGGTPDRATWRGQAPAIAGLPVSTIAHRHLLAFVQRLPGGTSVIARDADFNDSGLRDRVRPVYDEIPQLAIRLAKDQPALFDAFDRAHAEADFRVTVAVPLFALGLRLMWVWWPVGMLLLAGTPFMLAAAVTKEREANDVVIEAVCIDAVQSDAVNKLLAPDRSDTHTSRTSPPVQTRRVTPAGPRAKRRSVGG